MVPQSTNLREEILREFHCSLFAMHLGGTKMYRDLRCQYYWSEIKRHVGDFVLLCLTCQQVKLEHQRPAELLQPLEIAEWKWKHITMNFVTHFLRTLRKHDTVWVIVDQLTKSAHFLVVRMIFTLEEFYRLYIWGDLTVAWSASLHSIGSRSSVYGLVLEEFPEGHGDTVVDEYRFSSSDGWTIRADYSDFRGHVMSMRPGSQG